MLPLNICKQAEITASGNEAYLCPHTLKWWFRKYLTPHGEASRSWLLLQIPTNIKTKPSWNESLFLNFPWIVVDSEKVILIFWNITFNVSMVSTFILWSAMLLFCKADERVELCFLGGGKRWKPYKCYVVQTAHFKSYENELKCLSVLSEVYTTFTIALLYADCDEAMTSINMFYLKYISPVSVLLSHSQRASPTGSTGPRSKFTAQVCWSPQQLVAQTGINIKRYFKDGQ